MKVETFAGEINLLEDAAFFSSSFFKLSQHQIGCRAEETHITCANCWELSKRCMHQSSI